MTDCHLGEMLAGSLAQILQRFSRPAVAKIPPVPPCLPPSAPGTLSSLPRVEACLSLLRPTETLWAVRRLPGHSRHGHHGLCGLRALLRAGEPAENCHPHGRPGNGPGLLGSMRASLRPQGEPGLDPGPLSQPCSSQRQRPWVGAGRLCWAAPWVPPVPVLLSRGGCVACCQPCPAALTLCLLSCFPLMPLSGAAGALARLWPPRPGAHPCPVERRPGEPAGRPAHGGPVRDPRGTALPGVGVGLGLWSVGEGLGEALGWDLQG